MKFSIQSSELNNVLQTSGKIINPKHPISIMECFIFKVKDETLEITASDQETTQITSIPVKTMEREGAVAISSSLLLGVVKEFADQLLTFDVDEDNHSINLIWETGNIIIPGKPAYDYPNVKPASDGEEKSLTLEAGLLYELISLTIFATADKDTRPIMTGIYFDIKPDSLTTVATDAFKLVRIIRECDNSDFDEPASFILPKRPANILRSSLLKEIGDVVIKFDSRNIYFTFGNSEFICRAIEGRYPNYNGAIPTTNNNRIIVDRHALLSAIKRVSVCSDKSSNLVRFDIKGDKLRLEARDANFSVSADDSIVCNHTGDDIEIGFKNMLMVEMLSAFSSESIEILLSAPTRPGLFVPINTDSASERNCVALLMPIV